MRPRFPVYRTLLLASFVISLTAATAQVINFDVSRPFVDALSIAALILTAIATGGMLLGLWSFYDQMIASLDALHQNNFNHRIDTLASGELAKLVELMNQVVNEAKKYETLRADRTASANKAMNAMHACMDKPAIIVDLDKQTGKANPACQKMLNTQPSINLEFILRHNVNSEFAEAYKEAFSKNRRKSKASLPLRLSPSETDAKLYQVNATLLPFTGNGEDVKLGLILLEVANTVLQEDAH